MCAARQMEPWQRLLLDQLLAGYSIIQGFDDEESASGQETTRYWAELETCRANGRSSGEVSGPSGESYESHAAAMRDLAKQLEG